MTHPLERRQDWSLDELVELANSRLSGSAPAEGDERLSPSLTPRNLRRLVSEGAVDAPVRRGREAVYEPRHLDQLLRARALMSEGFSCSAIRKLRESAAEPAAALPSTASATAAPASASARALSFLDGLGQPAPVAKSSSAPPAGAFGLALGASPLEASAAARALGLSGRAGPPPSATSWSEAEAEPGLRVSVSSAAAAFPLTEEIKARAIAALEAAWARAQAR